MIDAEFDDLAAAAVYEVETQVLKAECAVYDHAAYDARWDLHLAIHPDGDDARMWSDHRATILAHYDRGFTDQPNANYRAFLIEFCCYGWRRDYDEWPSLFNLADRVSNDCGITMATARRRIGRMVNDPSPDRHLYLIRTQRMDEIRNGITPSRVGPWDGGMHPDMRLYVAAEGITDLMRQWYQQRCWHLEGAA